MRTGLPIFLQFAQPADEVRALDQEPSTGRRRHRVREHLGERPPSSQSALGVAIGLAGVVVLTVHTHSFSGAIRPVHVIAVLTAELAWSAGTLLQRRYVSAERILNFSCLQMLAVAAFQLLMGGIDREWIGFVPAHISLQSVFAVLYLVVFGSIPVRSIAIRSWWRTCRRRK
ncbi:MAG: hypothetical protein WA446_13440 [Steroidobacteraceae bacterium]